MDFYANNVINSITTDKTASDKMKSLINSPDQFHGYMNNFFSNFKYNLSNETINYILEYNSAYQEWSNKQTLLQMASKYDAEELSEIFPDFFVSHNSDSISRGVSKTSISDRKGPSNRKGPSKKK